MYYYAPDNNRTGRRAGLIAAACYLAAFLAVSLLVSFRTEYERPAEGILIDFGDDSDGSGTQNVALSETEEAASRPDTSQEEYLTQETDRVSSSSKSPWTHRGAYRTRPSIRRAPRPKMPDCSMRLCKRHGRHGSRRAKPTRYKRVR